MDEHNQTIMFAYGSVYQHLVACKDLLEAKITGCTSFAREFGIKEGMKGIEVI